MMVHYDEDVQPVILFNNRPFAFFTNIPIKWIDFVNEEDLLP